MHVAIGATIVLNIIMVNITYVYYAEDRRGDRVSSEKMASFISGLKKSKKHQMKDVTAKVTFIDLITDRSLVTQPTSNHVVTT